MSGFKSFSQNTTNNANVVKAQMNKHSATQPSTETQPSEAPGTVKDLLRIMINLIQITNNFLLTVPWKLF